MAKRKLSLLVQMMSNYSLLSEADRIHFADFIRSQQPPRTSSKKASKGEKVNGKLLKLLQEKTGASTVNCRATLVETSSDIVTAEQLLRARGLAVKSSDTEG